ncbi:ATP-binding cassette domain-containing protein [Propionibacterium australiense]|uniref:ABC transporter n=1 Tax=Propionibacterium australiense TaxID=119981 RepID=A0A383S5S5_9ACTN|nr:ATP-binding cassette domain-containing protein [Propionibacterium australiense]RLP09718.1 ATP-binding cassette domain-containing protein [Propionibacterium australiense]RLP10225.1 ATP-binding cassette domain-containing protein [Propionibacterium australiense]SYZ33183.1 ABC transporter [Propionibacterium australiense]VEH89376.1 Galactose/methyl galactoside import ATP-binding protein MglA [Propionibacterium australiense]
MSDAVLSARGLMKRFGRVVALDNADFEVRAGEVMAVVGDNGAGKSTLIKALTGALIPDAGQIFMNGQVVGFRSPIDARREGIETVYQTLAVAPALDITSNMFLGREIRKPGILGHAFRMLDKKSMREQARKTLDELGITTAKSVTQEVETLSGGQRQAVAVARAAAWGRRVVVLDEPTAALGVRESSQVLQLMARIREQGIAVVLISHNMPHVFEIADRIHIHRLGRRVAIVDPKKTPMTDVVAIMTGAMEGNEGRASADIVEGERR